MKTFQLSFLFISYLTLTSVVFECNKLIPGTMKFIKYLTLTSVVFELIIKPSPHLNVIKI